MNRNELGIWGVKFRADRGLLSVDMAKGLGVAASYLSNIENRRKHIPDDWFKRVCEKFDLTFQEATDLKLAIIRSNSAALVPVESENEVRLIAAYDKYRSELTKEKVEKIEAVMAEQSGHPTGAKMSWDGKNIPKGKALSILNRAQKARSKTTEIYCAFDPVSFIEHHLLMTMPNLGYEICDDHPQFLQRPDRRAFVDFTNGIDLFVREATISDAAAGGNESRFVLAHEIGHIVLHCNQSSGQVLSRHAVGSDHQYENKRIELEANLFAGALLVPPDAVHVEHTLFTLVNRYKCSKQVAKTALEDSKLWRASKFEGAFRKENQAPAKPKPNHFCIVHTKGTNDVEPKHGHQFRVHAQKLRPFS